MTSPVDYSNLAAGVLLNNNNSDKSKLITTTSTTSTTTTTSGSSSSSGHRPRPSENTLHVRHKSGHKSIVDSPPGAQEAQMNNWMTKVRAPLRYTTNGAMGSSATRLRPKVIAVSLVVAVVLLIILLFPKSNTQTKLPLDAEYDHFLHNAEKVRGAASKSVMAYNATYPRTPAVRTAEGRKYRIGMISDLDTNSKLDDTKNTWVAYYKKGYLSISASNQKVSVDLDGDEIALKSQLSQGGRSMELSELTNFNGKLYTVDDRTGVVYEVLDDKVLPWVILPDGDGTSSKGEVLV